MDIYNLSLKKHMELKGKFEITPRCKINNKKALSIYYTPGVASPSLVIKDNEDLSFNLTRKNNLIAVITDGSAVLGLGDIGPSASMPVMEGKCILFKSFGNIDAVPICLDTSDVNEFVKTVKIISKSFGGINLEDIKAPRCFEIEKKLKHELNIPVFHDDQHGTAIVVTAGIINALKVTNKKFSDVEIVINGAGAAGLSICDLLLKFKPKNIVLVDKLGAISKNEGCLNKYHKQYAKFTNKYNEIGNIKNIIKNKDIFIGVSSKNILNAQMVKSMKKDSIIFALANPIPEIMPDIAKKAGARIVATGRSDFPNQVNNLLAFPSIFRGALDVRAKKINDEMIMACTLSIANYIKEKDLNENNIIPSIFEKKLLKFVSKSVSDAAKKSKVATLT